MDDFLGDGEITYNDDGSFTQTFNDGSVVYGLPDGTVAAYADDGTLLAEGNTSGPVVTSPPPLSNFDRGIVEYGGALFKYALTKLSDGQLVWKPKQISTGQAQIMRARSPNLQGVIIPLLLIGGLFLLAGRK